jgi:hypothetical protein
MPSNEPMVFNGLLTKLPSMNDIKERGAVHTARLYHIPLKGFIPYFSITSSWKFSKISGIFS